jgi:hypothetical protein
MSIYGSFVSLQVLDMMNRGLGAPGIDDMRRFIEESESVADLAAEAGEAPDTEET